jgi:DNA helicase-2/ATP-dependent DNA helicase PcrA
MMENTEPRREDPDGEKVILTTIHQAKGLEWSAVFIIWCSEGMFPLARALREEGGLEEERRLFYVATTRAKDTLYYCHPLIDYGRRVGAVVVSPSRFLEELKPSRGSGLDCPYE